MKSKLIYGLFLLSAIITVVMKLFLGIMKEHPFYIFTLVIYTIVGVVGYCLLFKGRDLKPLNIIFLILTIIRFKINGYDYQYQIVTVSFFFDIGSISLGLNLLGIFAIILYQKIKLVSKIQ
ncbi:hypothetical protein [Spirochaeta cellobiosiphila]|uniref:hypothetical protein n=1 Tax=Spirochaeta cellobiosiphila TaxID=504483 RepID=UPI00048EF40D|nr:hypothetical protein [Spirochaeta cellobiosiphila]